jgi:hypothetical protein
MIKEMTTKKHPLFIAVLARALFENLVLDLTTDHPNNLRLVLSSRKTSVNPGKTTQSQYRHPYVLLFNFIPVVPPKAHRPYQHVLLPAQSVAPCPPLSPIPLHLYLINL